MLGNINEIMTRCDELAKRMRAELLYLSSHVDVTMMHWGGSLSSIEILAVLYGAILNCKSDGLDVTQKDKFLLSKGHAAAGMYVAMHQVGLLSDTQMATFQQDGCALSEIVEYNPECGFEVSGGSLGMGLSYAVGLALLAKNRDYKYKVYVEVGDGELDEGAVWEAVMAASQFKLDNLIMIIDKNELQSDGFTRDIMSWRDISKRLTAFGWQVVSCNGHDCGELLDAFVDHFSPNQPLAVIANTVKGKGVSFMEHNQCWHDNILTVEQLEQVRKEIGGGYEFRY